MFKKVASNRVRRLQAGFSIVELLVAILAVSAITGIGAYVFNSTQHKQPAANTLSHAPVKSLRNSAAPESVIPDGYAMYADTSLGLSFGYPKTWGTPVLTKDAAKMGEQLTIRYSAFPVAIFDQPIITLATADFTRSFGTDSFIPSGVKDYAKTRTAAIAHDAQRQAGSMNYSTTMLAVADNYYLTAAYDCVAGGVYIGGSAQLTNSAYGGFTIEYFDTHAKPDCTGNVSAAVKGYGAETSAQLNTVLSTVKSLK